MGLAVGWGRDQSFTGQLGEWGVVILECGRTTTHTGIFLAPAVTAAMGTGTQATTPLGQFRPYRAFAADKT